MTIQQALYLVKAQLQDNEQNREIFELIEKYALNKPAERTCARYENIEEE
jgi:hypothetical protein